MKNMPSVEDLKNLPQRSTFYVSFKALCLWGGAILSLMLVVGMTVSSFVISERESVAKEDIQRRVEIIAQSKADIIHTWLAGLSEKGRNLVESDATKLFATEMAKYSAAEDKDELPRALRAQKTYFTNAVKSYVQQHGLARASIVLNTKEVVVDAGDRLLLSDNQMKSITQALLTKKTVFAPLAVVNGALTLDMFQPIMDMGLEGQQQVAAVLMTSSVVTDDLLNFLSEGPLSLAGERTSLTQTRDGVLEFVDISSDGVRAYGIKNDILSDILAGKRTEFEFTPFVSPVDHSFVYGAASYVIGTPFKILQEFDESEALSAVKSFTRNTYALMLLVILLVSFVFIAIVSYLIGSRNRYRVSHQQQMINVLVRAVEIRDPYVRGHHERVARMGLDLANKMRLNLSERTTVYYAAMLSGVGKIFVPQKIMLKPAHLTSKEHEVMQQHVSHALKVFDSVDLDFPVAEVIGDMYERMDGTGYPLGKTGGTINLLSRLLAVCDVYCALTKPRSYRKALTVSEALAEMKNPSSGLDKGIVAILEDIVVDK